MATKVRIGFDQAELGTIEVKEGQLVSDNGPLRDMARHYALLAYDLAEDAGQKPEEVVTPEIVLDLIVARVRGRTWAEEVEDEDTPAGGKSNPAQASQEVAA